MPASSRERLPATRGRCRSYGLLETMSSVAPVCLPASGRSKRSSDVGVRPPTRSGSMRSPGAQLGLPVRRRLHHARVQAERRVVDEHPAVHRGQVDPPLHPRGERVQRTDRVVPVQAEVLGEVVAGAGRDADVRDAPGAGDRGHHRLRAVSSGHADHVGAVRDRLLHQLSQVSARFELDGVDAAAGRLRREADPTGLAVARARVDDQHPTPGRRRRRVPAAACRPGRPGPPPAPPPRTAARRRPRRSARPGGRTR